MKIPNWVADYIGIPFLDYGRTRIGADCWGLARMIWLDQIGLQLPELNVNPNRGDECQKVIAENIHEWTPIEPGTETQYDGVIMTGCYGEGRGMKRAAMHVGVVVAPGILIHTTEEVGSSSLLRYRERQAGHDIVSFYRHRSLMDIRSAECRTD